CLARLSDHRFRIPVVGTRRGPAYQPPIHVGLSSIASSGSSRRRILAASAEAERQANRICRFLYFRSGAVQAVPRAQRAGSRGGGATAQGSARPEAENLRARARFFWSYVRPERRQ